MRTIICALAALIIAGCWEAEPDQDSLGSLKDQVAAFPVEVHDVMARWAANRVAYGYILTYEPNVQLGMIVCRDERTDEPFPIEIRAMIRCLGMNRTTTYKGCLDYILNDVADLRPDKICGWESYQMKLSPQEMPPETEAERVTSDTIAEALLGPPPPKEIQLLLLGLSGIMGPAGFLCIQTKLDWACAPDPFGGPPGTSASAGGGDR